MSQRQFRVTSLVVPGLLVVAAWVAVGWIAMEHVLGTSVRRYGNVLPEARLAAWMAALFAGGAAAVVVLIAYLLLTRRRA